MQRCACLGQVHGRLCRESLKLANEKSCKSVAFPAISCGVYGYPPAKAAKVCMLQQNAAHFAPPSHTHDRVQVALKACAEHAGSVKEVHFVLFSKQNLETFQAEAEEQFGSEES